MSQDSLINMECTVCHNLNYQTKKSKGKANPGVAGEILERKLKG